MATRVNEENFLTPSFYLKTKKLQSLVTGNFKIEHFCPCFGPFQTEIAKMYNRLINSKDHTQDKRRISTEKTDDFWWAGISNKVTPKSFTIFKGDIKLGQNKSISKRGRKKSKLMVQMNKC